MQIPLFSLFFCGKPVLASGSVFTPSTSVSHTSLGRVHSRQPGQFPFINDRSGVVDLLLDRLELVTWNVEEMWLRLMNSRH